METIDPKWDERFLEMAEFVSQWSKDPSTKVGAVLVRPDRTVASIGYNGFPRGIDDDDARYQDRDLKYRLIVHAEMNAILNAREPLNGYTLYTWPMPCCDRCAVHVIQAGVKRIVSARPASIFGRWQDACDRASALCEEAGVEYER